MSKIGNTVITLPKGVKVTWNQGTVLAEGPKGKLSEKIHPDIELEIGPDKIQVKRKHNEDGLKAVHGLTRALLANMIRGVSTGFSKALDIVGVGFKAELKGKDLTLNIGYSHPVVFVPPQGIEYKTPAPNRILVEGVDRQKVGQCTANIRAVKVPEPYKGTGIKYENEVVRKKAGKAAV